MTKYRNNPLLCISSFLYPPQKKKAYKQRKEAKNL